MVLQDCSTIALRQRLSKLTAVSWLQLPCRSSSLDSTLMLSWSCTQRQRAGSIARLLVPSLHGIALHISKVQQRSATQQQLTLGFRASSLNPKSWDPVRAHHLGQQRCKSGLSLTSS